MLDWISKRINLPIFFLGQIWWYSETSHYGWNFYPQSDGEVLADGLVFVITALALVAAAIERSSDVQNASPAPHGTQD